MIIRIRIHGVIKRISNSLPPQVLLKREMLFHILIIFETEISCVKVLNIINFEKYLVCSLPKPCCRGMKLKFFFLFFSGTDFLKINKSQHPKTTIFPQAMLLASFSAGMIYDVAVSLIIFSLSFFKYLFMTHILYFSELITFCQLLMKERRREHNKRYLFHGRKFLFPED